MSDLARRLIGREEGLKLSVYQDHLGYWTIGFGHLVDARLGGQIPRQMAEDLLDHDINQVVDRLAATYPWFSGLDDVRQAVFISLGFQLGFTGLAKFHNTLAAAALGDWNACAAYLLHSKLATQTPARIQRLANALISGKSADLGF